MAFSDAFIDDLRARVKVSEIVGRKVKLKRNGGEYRAVDDNSLTVNDDKRLWWDHGGSKNEGGDIFAWLTEREGLSFPDAVAEIAAVAGVDIPEDARDRRGGSSARRNPRDQGAREDGPPDRGGDDPGPSGPEDYGAPASEPAAPREITRTYDYCDPQGALIYQVCRLEWSDGGKKKKTFLQRRPTPEGDGHWIWGLAKGEYLQSKFNGDWYAATKDRVERWKGARRRTIAEGVEHALYRLLEARESDPDEPIWVTEGEKDADTLWGWELPAITNSGGAKNFREDHAECLRDRHVIIAVDNDEAGREGAERKARILHKVAASVRLLDFADVWAGAPEGADVTDWKEQAGGNPAQLLAIAEKLPRHVPQPRASRFGLVMWSEQDQQGEEYDYLVEDLIPQEESVLIMGESQSGKSFFTEELGLCGARGVPFFGHRVIRPFGVVYLAYEAGKGFRHRLRAARKHHSLPLEGIPFAVLTKPIDLWSNALNTDQLIEEIGWIAEERFEGVPLGAVVIDTHNRANPGASEIDSKEVSQIIDRYTKIMRSLRCGVWIVGHKNASGKHRGNEQLYNNIDTCIDIEKVFDQTDKSHPMPMRDPAGRQLRRVRVRKQREGADGETWDFVLANIEVGTNKYGKPRTSCVAVAPETGPGGTTVDSNAITAAQQRFMAALNLAMDEHGVPAPPALKLPRSIARVVDYEHVKAEYAKAEPNDGEEEQRYRNRMRTALSRARTSLQDRRFIGVSKPWIWPTGRAFKARAQDHEGSDQTTGTASDDAPPAWHQEAFDDFA